MCGADMPSRESCLIEDDQEGVIGRAHSGHILLLLLGPFPWPLSVLYSRCCWWICTKDTVRKSLHQVFNKAYAGR